MTFHPLAELFPLMEGAEFGNLIADIKANGLNEPIVLHEDMILDGRNRYRACQAAGVNPHFRPFAGGDPAEYVISANIHRRHLTAAQKRDLIAKLIKADPEKSSRQIAKAVGVSHTHVNKARSEMEETGDVETVSTSKDTKGRKQLAKRKGKKRTKKRRPRGASYETPKQTQHERDLQFLRGAWDSACQSAREEFLRGIA